VLHEKINFFLGELSLLEGHLVNRGTYSYSTAHQKQTSSTVMAEALLLRNIKFFLITALEVGKPPFLRYLSSSLQAL